MKFLPITKEEYAQTVLLADFIAKIKVVVQSDKNIAGIKFVPEIQGYDISFSQNDVAVKIILIKDDSDGMYIEKYVSGKLTDSYLSHSKDDNSTIMNCIFNCN